MKTIFWITGGKIYLFLLKYKLNRYSPSYRALFRNTVCQRNVTTNCELKKLNLHDASNWYHRIATGLLYQNMYKHSKYDFTMTS